MHAYIKYQGYYKRWFDWKAGTYRVDAWSSFDVSYTYNGTNFGPYSKNVNRNGQMVSPISMVSYINKDNSAYTIFAIGNVDCGGVDMGDNLECMWAQGNGCLGVEESDGYCSMWQMGNTY